jgi:orotate phosphoribosyltransferase-like protein
MNNRERLMELVAEHQLERHEVAELLKVKQETVGHWLLSNESRSHEEVPDMAIELLELKLKLGLRKVEGSGAAS